MRIAVLLGLFLALGVLAWAVIEVDSLAASIRVAASGPADAWAGLMPGLIAVLTVIIGMGLLVAVFQALKR